MPDAESAKVEPLARFLRDDRVARAVLYRETDGGVVLNLWVRARYMPVPHTFTFRGTIDEVVAQADQALTDWPPLPTAGTLTAE